MSGAPCRSGRTRCRPVSQSGASPGNGVSRSPAGRIYGGRRGRCDGRSFMSSLAAVVSFLSSGISFSYSLAAVSSDERPASCCAVFRHLTERVVRSFDSCVPDYLLEYARAAEKRPEEPPKPQRKSSSGPPDLRACDDGNRRAVCRRLFCGGTESGMVLRDGIPGGTFCTANSKADEQLDKSAGGWEHQPG